MQKDISFVDLLKETADLIRDHRPFSRGNISKQIALVIQRALIKAMPKIMTDYHLEQHELLFLCTLIVEPDVCRDVIRQFSRFWAGSHAGALHTQMNLELSISDGRLKAFVEDEGSQRIRIKPELRLNLLTALVAQEIESCT